MRDARYLFSFGKRACDRMGCVGAMLCYDILGCRDSCTGGWDFSHEMREMVALLRGLRDMK